MLVLTRKYQEKIRIGDNITITVLRTKGKAVRLGIEAPNDVPVIRGELSFQESSNSVSSASQPPDNATSATHVAHSCTTERRLEPASTWARTPPLHAADVTCDAQSAGQVELKRVPRAKVAQLLPKLVSGTAPLRAMMDQR